MLYYCWCCNRVIDFVVVNVVDIVDAYFVFDHDDETLNGFSVFLRSMLTSVLD